MKDKNILFFCLMLFLSTSAHPADFYDKTYLSEQEKIEADR